MSSLTPINNLAALNSGAVQELYEQRLDQILENMDNPNYHPTKARTMVITLIFAQDMQKEKMTVGVEIDVKLPKRFGHIQNAYKQAGRSWEQGVDPNKRQIEIEDGIHQINEREVV